MQKLIYKFNEKMLYYKIDGIYFKLKFIKKTGHQSIYIYREIDR